MMLLLFFPVGLLALGWLETSVSARQLFKSPFHAHQNSASHQFHKVLLAVNGSSGVQNITFSNHLASQFYVDGKTLPQVDFDIGPSWSGLLPISGDANETRQLFFWFFPPGPEGDLNKLTIWLEGGPGCSSLKGVMQEVGPFSWLWGQAKPTVNQYSWTNLSSMLFVEQPVGTGFSQGVPNIQDETDLSQQFVGFLNQFLSVFSELKGKRTFLSGESYAGTYIPYIADCIYANTTAVDLDLDGIWMSDPLVSWIVTQAEIPAVPFVHKYKHVFAFNQSFMAYLDEQAAVCNYAGYFDKYLHYPPTGLLPLPGNSTYADPNCDLWTDIFNAALIINPAFNIYRIFDVYPILWDVLGSPGTFFQTQLSPIYFDREDVKMAIHAPLNTTWAECSNINVFPNGDASLPPAFTVLPGIIERNKRTVIMHGLADYVLIAEGARLALQNMTWNGKQGFECAPKADSFIIDGIGAFGTVQSERNLTYYEVSLSGHMITQFQPWAAYQGIQYLMGLRDTP